MDDGDHPFTTSNVILVLIGFPWSVLVLLDQLGLLDPILRAIGV